MFRVDARTTGRLLLALVVLVVFAAPLLAEQAAGPPLAEVSHVEGSASFRVKTGDYAALSKGQKLGADHTVRTAADGRVELTLPDKSVLRIAPLSVVRLESLLSAGPAADKPSTFRVTGGKIWANVSSAVGGERKFEVKTETAVAGVRGTVFQVAVGEDTATVVKVYAGAVAVSSAVIPQRAPDPTQERVQVPGPQEVSRQQWEELVAKEMQQVRVSARGVMERTAFSLDPADTEWEAWNLERDKALGR